MFGLRCLNPSSTSALIDEESGSDSGSGPGPCLNENNSVNQCSGQDIF